MLRHNHPEIASGISPDVKKLTSIDAFRGWAVLLVLLVHSSQFFIFRSKPLGDYLLQAARGVQLFYVLSAFSLMYGYYTRLEKGMFNLRDYFIRRVFRIAPLFWIVTLFYLYMQGFGPRHYAPDGVGLREIITTMLFINAWHPALICPIVTVGWSVAIEMMFYAVLPFIFRYVTNLRKAIYAFIGSLVFAWAFGRLAMHLFKHIFPPSWQEINYAFAWTLSLPAQLPVFVTGVVFYFVYRALVEIDDDKIRAAIGKVFILCGIIFLIVISRHSVENKIISEYTQYGLIWGLLLTGCLVNPLPFVDNRLTRFFGIISYSAYLWHVPILEFIQKIAQKYFQYKVPESNIAYFIFLPGFLAVTALLAWISFRAVEKPGIRLGEKLIAKLKTV